MKKILLFIEDVEERILKKYKAFGHHSLVLHKLIRSKQKNKGNENKKLIACIPS